MDVSKWPLEEVMALPDWCFGKRWWIGMSLNSALAEAVPFFLDENVPDVFVLWDVLLMSAPATGQTRWDMTIRLCKQEPTTANVRQFRRLLRGLANPTDYYEIQVPGGGLLHFGPMRNLIEARNDKIGGIFKRIDGTAPQQGQIGFLISGIPREVPDWVVSGLVKMR